MDSLFKYYQLYWGASLNILMSAEASSNQLFWGASSNILNSCFGQPLQHSNKQTNKHLGASSNILMSEEASSTNILISEEAASANILYLY